MFWCPAAQPLDAAGIRHPAPPIPFSALARSASPRPLMRFSSRRSRHRRPPAFPIRKRPRGMPRACRCAALSLPPPPLPQAQCIAHSPCSPRRMPARAGPLAAALLPSAAARKPSGAPAARSGAPARTRRHPPRPPPLAAAARESPLPRGPRGGNKVRHAPGRPGLSLRPESGRGTAATVAGSGV